ncbi:MAG TPA: hypothetical protein VJB82_00255 [Candidatus Peribacterales bacterium]|nr:hypothetical protein [Candidatus Peribacterales bacterium]
MPTPSLSCCETTDLPNLAELAQPAHHNDIVISTSKLLSWWIIKVQRNDSEISVSDKEIRGTASYPCPFAISINEFRITIQHLITLNILKRDEIATLRTLAELRQQAEKIEQRTVEITAPQKAMLTTLAQLLRATHDAIVRDVT